MTETKQWSVSGEYFETCSCDFVCPCFASNLAAEPTQGFCDAALVFRVDRGQLGDISLDGLAFAMVLQTPGVMGHGNWTVGLIIDERASSEQAEALTTIASGQVGGPPAGMAPLIGTFAGVERSPIEFTMDGMMRSVSVPGMLDQAVQGVPSLVADGEPLYVDNTAHPANTRLALATALRSHMHVFGIDWDATSGKTNGHFAPFEWHG
jgi:hypothetical protein